MDPEMIILSLPTSVVGMLLFFVAIIVALVARKKMLSSRVKAVAGNAVVPGDNEAVMFLTSVGHDTVVDDGDVVTGSSVDTDGTHDKADDLQFQVRVTVRRRVRRKNHGCSRRKTDMRVVGVVRAHDVVEALDSAWARYGDSLDHAERNLRVWLAT